MLTPQQRKANAIESEYHRRAVCRHCNSIMSDSEPDASGGDFYHKTEFANGKSNPCPHAGGCFSLIDDPKVIQLFVPKNLRRLAKRLGVDV